MTAIARVMEDVGNDSVALLDEPVTAVPEMGQGEASAPVVEPEEAPAAIAGALHARIGDQRFELWFGEKTRLALAGNSLVVETANAFAARWIRERFSADLAAAAAEVMGRPLELSIRVREAETGAGAACMPAPGASDGLPVLSPASKASRAAAAIDAAHRRASPINAKYTLEDFVVGPSNLAAYRAAIRVAEHPGSEFSPLFLHGHCGLGKTHLLQGICHRFARVHPGKKWLYLTGEQFTNEFLEAIKAHKTDTFRRRIRNADLLVLDDIHFLANKKATQEEFLHTFNQIDSSGKQVVLASDCGPRQIQSLSEQLSSRFVSGMVLRIDSPELPTRLEILRRRVARNGWNVGDTLLMHIARTAVNSVRELEGLLLQVVAGIRLIDSGAAETGAALATLRERTALAGPVPTERIVAAVARHFGIAESAIMGSGREKTVSLARALTMHLTRRHTAMSYPEIARALGNKNHSTAVAACQRIEAMITAGEILCWNAEGGPRHQAISDALHELEAAIRRFTVAVS